MKLSALHSSIALSSITFCLLAGSAATHAEPFLALQAGQVQSKSILSTNDDDTVWRVSGGWQFGEHFALSLGYSDFGEFNDSFVFKDGVGADVNGSIQMESTVYDLTAHGLLPMGDGFGFTAKIGVEQWDTDATISANPLVRAQDNADGVDAYAGIGAVFNVGDSMSLTLDYDVHKWEEVDLTALTLGLQFHFGGAEAVEADAEQE